MIAELKQEEDKEEAPIKPFFRRQGETEPAKWEQLGLKEELTFGLLQHGYYYPSQIQYTFIPEIVNSHPQDILCQAGSGMGKTGLFVASLLQLMRPQNFDYTPHQALIITNTRQMAYQIYKEVLQISRSFKFPPIRVGHYIGGTILQQNSKELVELQSPHIIVGTVGRLLDLFKRNYINGKATKYVVIDECDNLLYYKDSRLDIQQILGRIQPNRRMLLFTATLSQLTKNQCLKVMKPQNTKILYEAGKEQTKSNIKHYFLKITEKDKIQRLEVLLDAIPFNQVIVFMNTVDRAMALGSYFQSRFFNPAVMHSNMLQKDRARIYQLAKTGSSKLIISTDIFGRGIDFPSVNLVINYDFPRDLDTYKHRAARAARFGRKGKTINFLLFPEQTGNRNIEEQTMRQFAKISGIEFQHLPNRINPDVF